MTDSFDERRKALEDQYFETQNQAALQRIKAQGGSTIRTRPSPVTGKPMEQVTLMGVVVDRCTDTGGIWLDNGELEQILTHIKDEKEGHGRIMGFLEKLIRW